MEGINRLEQEAISLNNHNVILIFDYIKNKEELKEKFNNKEKTIKEMYDFICNKAKNLAVKNVAMINDKVVYLWAMAYFNKSNEELGITPKPTTPQKETSKLEENKEEPKKEKTNNQVSLFEGVKE